MVYLDTQSTIWLYEGRRDKFSNRVQELILSQELRISPIVALELQYLFERGRIAHAPKKILAVLNSDFDLAIDRNDFAVAFDVALQEGWTRDPFDRVIASHAKKNEAVLITSDKIIRENYKRAVW